MLRGKILPGSAFGEQLAQFVVPDPAGTLGRSNAGLFHGGGGGARDIAVDEPSSGETEPIRMQQLADDADILGTGGIAA
jgi:hypothetical protein